MIGAGALIVVLVFAYAFVYRQYAGMHQDTPAAGTAMVQPTQTMPKAVESGAAVTVAPQDIPTSIDGISQSIESESNVDTSALDDETESEMAQVESDSQSVNDLGNSYDENNL